MSETEHDFIKLVDDFVINSKDPDVLEEIAQLDQEARLLGITFYDMYCVTLQNTKGHQNLVSRFRLYVKNTKTV